MVMGVVESDRCVTALPKRIVSFFLQIAKLLGTAAATHLPSPFGLFTGVRRDTCTKLRLPDEAFISMLGFFSCENITLEFWFGINRFDLFVEHCPLQCSPKCSETIVAFTNRQWDSSRTVSQYTCAVARSTPHHPPSSSVSHPRPSSSTLDPTRGSQTCRLCKTQPT